MTNACTVVIGASGEKCGKPAVFSFVGTDGVTMFHECAEHSTAHVARRGGSAGAYVVGDAVTVRRYGRDYPAKVTRVTRTGRAFATFTYDNGAERTVEVGS